MYLLSDKDKYRMLSREQKSSFVVRVSPVVLPSIFMEQCIAWSPLRVNRIISQPYFLLGMGRLGLNRNWSERSREAALTIQLHNRKQQWSHRQNWILTNPLFTNIE